MLPSPLFVIVSDWSFCDNDYLDVVVAFERTLPELEDMVSQGGLKIKKVYATR